MKLSCIGNHIVSIAIASYTTGCFLPPFLFLINYKIQYWLVGSNGQSGLRHEQM